MAVDESSLAARIKALSPTLANQIAAGEVVERPCAVLKELLENSIDSAATRIKIELTQGGKQVIKVSDNGHGIVADDLPLAISRHATSKISKSSDLSNIASLGFRGEALASIASVSRLSIKSRAKGVRQAYQLQVCGRDMENIKLHQVAHPQGTTVVVEDLFYNTPARRHFLRGDRTEYNHCEELIKRIALSNFAIGIDVQHNSHQVLQLPPASVNRELRIKKILGKSFLSSAHIVKASAVGLALDGWISSQDFCRSQMDMNYFYVNQRIVRDKLINHAVRQVYEQLLPSGRHPAYCLFLTTCPNMVDVNVHPTKHEVRFVQGRLVHDFIVDALNKALATETNIPSAHDNLANHDIGAAYIPSRLKHDQNTAPAAVTVAGVPALGSVVTTIDNYVLTKQERSFWLIDFARAYQALLGYELEQALSGAALRCQPLLVPQTIEATTIAIEQLPKMQPLLVKLGFDLQILTENTLVLRGIPARLRFVEQALLLKNLLALVMASPIAGEAMVNSLSTQANQIEASDLSAEELTAILYDLAAWARDCTTTPQPWIAITSDCLRQLFDGKT